MLKRKRPVTGLTFLVRSLFVRPVLSDKVLKAFEAEVGEAGRMVLTDAPDGQAPVLGLHVDQDLPEEVDVFAEDVGGGLESEDTGDGGHD